MTTVGRRSDTTNFFLDTGYTTILMSTTSHFAPADGRAFTSYVSSSLYNQALETKYGIADSTQYRAFLQNNGDVVRAAMETVVSYNPSPPSVPHLAPTSILPGGWVATQPAKAMAPSQHIVPF